MTLADLAATGPAQLLRRAFSWWIAELATMLPRRLARRLARWHDAAPAVLEMSRGAAALVLTGRGGEVNRIPLDGVDAGLDRARVDGLMRRRRDAVTIAFDHSLLLESSTTLPIAAERSLRPVLQHQLDRLVPLPADQVEFQYSILSRSLSARTVTVRLVVATRDSIRRAVERAQALGLRPRQVVAAGDANAGNAAGAPPVVLWRPGRDATGFRRLRRVLEITILVFLVAGFATALYRLDTAHADLEDDVARAARGAIRARALAQQITQGEAALAVLDRRQKMMDPLTLLDELTRLLPDETWVTQLTMRGREVEIIGFSPAVGGLIGGLEGHDVFTNARFRAPITRSPDGTGERFDIGFEIGPEAPK